MPSSSAEARARWRKRKREHQAACKSKLKEHENDDTLEDNEEDDDPDLDPPQNHLETDADLRNNIGNWRNQIWGEKESEKLVDGGVKICEFPIAIKRVVSRPHSSVFGIVEAERAARNGESQGEGQARVAVLENISYGQLQALSAVPRKAPSEESASGSGDGSYVIMPPRIIAGSGVTKWLGSAGCVHVVPLHADWFSPNSVHRLEKQVVPHFFSGKSAEHTPEKYMESRNFIVAKYVENPEKHLSVADCQGLVAGFDIDDLTRILRFLDHWGIINYCATLLKHEVNENGTYLCEDSNNELRVPSAAFKAIDSLIQFDKPTCRLSASDVYPELACQRNGDSDLDSTIREKLSAHRCNCCSRSIPTVYYESQKEADVMLCADCFHEGRFIAGHSSLDFSKVDSSKDYRDVDGDSWSNQETLLLLEGMQLYNENWKKIAEHVGSKSKAQCLLHFVCLPLDGAPLESIDVPSTAGSSNLWNDDNHERLASSSYGFSDQEGDFESKFPFAKSGNPVMNLVAFLASALGPRVAGACAHASLASLSADGGKEATPNGDVTNSSKNGPRSQNDEPVPLSAQKVKDAAKDGLAAAAVKAKLFADHEEREIQRLSASIINHQLKRLELKLKQFAEVETLLIRECEQMERMRQRITLERALMMSVKLGSAGASQPVGLPGVGAATVNSTSGNSREEVPGSQQPFISGHGNNQPIHPCNMRQQGMNGLGPRLPLSAVQPSSPASNSMFSPGSNSQSSLGHPMFRPVSGTKSGFG